MIYDCFPFFNELDVLEIRLHELYEVVDRFVLVEATQTFQKKPKPLYFADNQSRFAPFLDKITHIVVDEFPGFFAHFRRPTAWDYSNYQKNQITKGLANARPDDLIMVSDLDEIPRAAFVRQSQYLPGVKVFQQKLFNYFLNCAAIEAPVEKHLVKRNGYVYWRGTVMLNFRDFKSFPKARLLRDNQSMTQVEDGGWHFSFLGGWQKVADKLQAWEHAKEATYRPDYLSNPERLKEIVENGEDLFGRNFLYQFIALDESYPAYVLQNQDKLRELIK